MLLMFVILISKLNILHLTLQLSLKKMLSFNVRYVRRSRPLKHKNGSKVYTLVCHRKGPVTSHMQKESNQNRFVNKRRDLDTAKSTAFVQNVLQCVKQVMEKKW